MITDRSDGKLFAWLTILHLAEDVASHKKMSRSTTYINTRKLPFIWLKISSRELVLPEWIWNCFQLVIRQGLDHDFGQREYLWQAIVKRRSGSLSLGHPRECRLIPTRTIVIPVRQPELLGRINIGLFLDLAELRRLAEALGYVGNMAEQRLLGQGVSHEDGLAD